MFVEDAVEVMAEYCMWGDLFGSVATDRWASDFVCNVATYTSNKRPLSTEQAKIILKLAARMTPEIVEKVRKRCPSTVKVVDFEAIRANPTYRLPLYQSANILREVRFLGDNKLGFRFKRNDTIIADIKALAGRRSDGVEAPFFNREHKMWVVSVCATVLSAITTLIDKHRFHADEDVFAYLTACTECFGQPSTFVADAELGLIACHIQDHPILAWWASYVADGEVA